MEVVSPAGRAPRAGALGSPGGLLRVAAGADADPRTPCGGSWDGSGASVFPFERASPDSAPESSSGEGSVRESPCGESSSGDESSAGAPRGCWERAQAQTQATAGADGGGGLGAGGVDDQGGVGPAGGEGDQGGAGLTGGEGDRGAAEEARRPGAGSPQAPGRGTGGGVGHFAADGAGVETRRGPLDAADTRNASMIDEAAAREAGATAGPGFRASSEADGSRAPSMLPGSAVRCRRPSDQGATGTMGLEPATTSSMTSSTSSSSLRPVSFRAALGRFRAFGSFVSVLSFCSSLHVLFLRCVALLLVPMYGVWFRLRRAALCCALRFAAFALSSRPIPRHVAFIMDGNRRFADRLGKPTIAGHERGYDSMLDALSWCLDVGVERVSVFAFSVDNFRRSDGEKRTLMALAEDRFGQMARDGSIAGEKRVRVVVSGRGELVPRGVADAARGVETATCDRTQATLYVCFAFTSSAEADALLERGVAPRDAWETAVGGEKPGRPPTPETARPQTLGPTPGAWSLPLHPEGDLSRTCLPPSRSSLPSEGDVSPPLFRSLSLELCARSPPPVDLVIRTSGERRLSDFLTFQSACAELFFSQQLWPELTLWEIARAILRWQDVRGDLERAKQVGERAARRARAANRGTARGGERRETRASEMSRSRPTSPRGTSRFSGPFSPPESASLHPSKCPDSPARSTPSPKGVASPAALSTPSEDDA